MPNTRHHGTTMFLTSDLALRFDPIYEPISRRFYENPEEFAGCVRSGLVQAPAP